MSGNNASVGGGIYNQRGTATLTNTTVSGNKASGYGGGIHNNGTATLTNSIVLGNSGPNEPEISGTIIEKGPNVIGGSATDVFAETVDNDGVAAGLLADNGGPVQTIALKNDASNPALDAGQDDRLDESVAGIDLNSDCDTDDVIDTDARGSGFDRLINLPDVANNGVNTVDLGAFEVPAGEPGGPDLIPVTVTFKGADADYANAFGIYDTSTMKAELLAVDLNETADGAVLFDAALTADQLEHLGFFLIPDGANQNADLASLVGEELTVTDTPAGYAVSFEGTPLSGRWAPGFFSDPALNREGADHFVEDGTPARYGLSVEDRVTGVGLDFDDALILVETGAPQTGARVEVTFESESAGFRNTFGYSIEDTGEAGILFADVDESTLAPGTTKTVDLTAQQYDKLAFFLVPDGATKNADLFANLDAIDLIVEEVNGGLQARDQTTGTVLEGYVNPVYVPGKAGNPDATRHALQVGDVDDFELRWGICPAAATRTTMTL